MDMTHALGAIRHRLQENPRHADAWNDLATLLAYDGQWVAALSAAESALDLNPEYTEARISRCFLMAELGDVNGALREFKRIQVRNPDSFEMIFPLAVFCLRFGWPDTGAQLMLRAEEERSHVPYVSLFVAAALREVGDRVGARERQQRALQEVEALPFEDDSPEELVSDARIDALRRWRSPLLIHAYVIQAHNAGTDDDAWHFARETLAYANRRYPGHPRLMVALGQALLAEERLDEAVDWLGTAAHLHRHCHEASIELGFLHAEADAIGEAEQSLRNAVALRPLFPDYRYHLGTFLLEIGKVDEGIDQLQRVLSLNPNYGHALLHLANAWLQLGRAEEVITALSVGPCRDWPEAWLLLARAHVARNDSAEARPLLDKVIAIDPTNAEARQLLNPSAT